MFCAITDDKIILGLIKPMNLICKFWFNLNLKFQMTSAVDMCSSSSNSLLTYTYARDIKCLLDSDQLIVDQNMMKKKIVRLELVHANLC